MDLTGDKMQHLKITMDVRWQNVELALRMVEHFVEKYPDHFRDVRPERHGVGYRVSGVSLFVYGNARHVRVKESVGD